MPVSSIASFLLLFSIFGLVASCRNSPAPSSNARSDLSDPPEKDEGLWMQLCRVNPFRDAEYDRIKSCVENQPLFADNMEIRNYTDQQIPQFQRKCEKDPNYNPSGKLISERSISPWKWVLNIDENRIPREILQAECLCHYCLDPRTGRENYNVDSSPINLEYYVQNNNGELVSEEIPIGCQCNYQSDNY
ncbi:uncharacterized protein LOC143470968 isoform X2 [Clavelina lepadiformis]|uniref:uncharacterized protein LOC143470968 isoform X2 n=1 Tax=Clavelina lepadiformis TaxID=159417 RepID=UPI004042E5ED